MKATRYQVENVRAALEHIRAMSYKDAYRRGEFPNADKCKDRMLRFRWDAFYAAGGIDLLTLPGMEDSGDMDARTGSLTDAHVDTLLRHILGD